ncbi:MAG: hypothetical protein ACI3YQ_00475 [Prevotella sp.]
MRYLNRIIDRYLEEWKQESDRKPLLIRGARQVGKSCAVRHFGSFVSPIGKPISICPLYAISNIISKTLTSNPIA